MVLEAYNKESVKAAILICLEWQIIERIEWEECIVRMRAIGIAEEDIQTIMDGVNFEGVNKDKVETIVTKIMTEEIEEECEGDDGSYDEEYWKENW